VCVCMCVCVCGLPNYAFLILRAKVSSHKPVHAAALKANFI